MLDTTLYTLPIRFLQGVNAAAPTLVVGIVVAGMLRAMATPEQIRRLFGSGTSRGLWLSLVWGTLLPVCSLGVLPVALELRRARVSASSLLTFVLAAPLVSPMTLAQATAALDVWTVGVLLSSVLVVSLGCGAIARRWDEPPSEGSEEGPVASSSLRRIAGGLVASARIATGATLGLALVGLVLGGLAATCFDGHALNHAFRAGNPLAAPVMIVAGLPAYVAPAGGIMRIYGMEAMGLSLAAILALHLFGVGQNVALLGWLGRTIGGRRVVAMLCVLAAFTWVAGLAIDRAAAPGASSAHSHDHAEHEHGACCSSEENHALVTLGRWEYTHLPNPFVEAFRFNHPGDNAALAALGVLLAMGLLLRVFRIEVVPDRGPTSGADRPSLWERAIPSRWFAVGAGIAVPIVGVVMVYVYYPPTDEILTQMRFVKANAIVAIRTGHEAQALRELEFWEDLAGKLPTSWWLRGGGRTTESVSAVGALQSQIRELRRAVLDDRPRAEIDDLARNVQAAHERCRRAFVRPEKVP